MSGGSLCAWQNMALAIQKRRFLQSVVTIIICHVEVTEQKITWRIMIYICQSCYLQNTLFFLSLQQTLDAICWQFSMHFTANR